MKFGVRLKQLRQEKGLTQFQFGSCFNLAESTISLYESGKRSPDYDLLGKFALFFDVSVDYLLGATNERRPAGVYENKEMYNINGEPSFVPVKLPVITSITYGAQGLTYEKSSLEEWAVNQDTCDANYYWLHVKSDFVTGDGIFPGDLVLIREQPQVEYGDISLVIINGGPGSIYRVYKKDNCILLHSSNPAYPPQIFTGKDLAKVRIVGKIIEVKRKL